MNKPGIKGYKHLNDVMINILKESEEPLSAAQIVGVIENNYRTKKVFVKSLSIAKRLQGYPGVKRILGKRGHFLYSYEDS
jgi:predicted Zn-ribbon and HTH transcriptional regulator